MKPQTNTLVVLAVATNPLVWAAVCFGLAALVLYGLFVYCREECRVPLRRMEPTAIDLDECEEVPEPAPVAQVDEFGRVEMYTPEPVLPAEKPRPTTVQVTPAVRTQASCSQEAKSESVCTRKSPPRSKARPKPKPRPSGRKAKKTAVGGAQ